MCGLLWVDERQMHLAWLQPEHIARPEGANTWPWKLPFPLGFLGFVNCISQHAPEHSGRSEIWWLGVAYLPVCLPACLPTGITIAH